MFSEVSSEPVLPTRSLNSPYPYALGYPQSLSSKNLDGGGENFARKKKDQGPGSTEKKTDICHGAHFDK